MGAAPAMAVLTADGLYTCSDDNYKEVGLELKEVEVTDRRGQRVKSQEWTTPQRWSVEAPGGGALIQAGSRLYGGAKNTLCAVDLPRDGKPAGKSWQVEIDGTPTTLLAADDRLFAVSLEGRIYCL